jgi:hypothetical protein
VLIRASRTRESYAVGRFRSPWHAILQRRVISEIDWLAKKEQFYSEKSEFFLAPYGGAAVEQAIESQNKFFRA